MKNDFELQRVKLKIDDVTKPLTMGPCDGHRFAKVFHGDNRLSTVKQFLDKRLLTNRSPGAWVWDCDMLKNSSSNAGHLPPRVCKHWPHMDSPGARN